jgi:hypothetical protein
MERANESELIRHRTPDEVLDQAVALTFPASDPIAVDIAYARGKAAEARAAPEKALDDAAEMTFPASDPIAVDVAYDRQERIKTARAKLRKKRAHKQAA